MYDSLKLRALEGADALGGLALQLPGIFTPSTDALASGPQQGEPQLCTSADRDRLLHWWCMQHLARCLRKLSKLPEAGPFREPLPWRELELLDYPELVPDPTDLRTIEKGLNEGSYNDSDGLVDPELFWEDVSRCWDSCRRYYSNDNEVEAVQMAKAMATESARLQLEFWEELERFEASLETVEASLGSAVVVADVAAKTVEDLASTAYEEGGVAVEDLWQRAAGWWQQSSSGAFWTSRDALRPRAPSTPRLATSSSLKEHYLEVLRLRFNYDGTKALAEQEARVYCALEKSSFLSEEAVEADTEWEGTEEKIPLERLLPSSYLNALGAAGDLKLSRWRGGSRRPSTASSQSSLRSLENLLAWRGRLTPRSMEGGSRPRTPRSAEGGSRPRTPR